MGNYLSKELEEPLTCTHCTRQNIEPAYFTKKPNATLIHKVNTDDVERYDKNKKRNNTENYEDTSYIYVCSNGHELNNY
jgi:hypothetical protein